MKPFFRRSCMVAILLLIFSAALQAFVPAVQAQSVSIAWGQPIQLTDPTIQSWSPTIAADSAGNVHILWAQTMVAGGFTMGDTLYYTRWDGEKWTTPSDVLVSPNGQGAQGPDIAVTPDGILHAVWNTGGTNGDLLYSRAPACCAEDPHNWTTPTSLGKSVNLTSAIVSDSKGILHLVYASLTTLNIVYQQSVDSGKTWSQPVEIDGAARRGDEYPAYPRLSVDLRGRIHLVWTVMPFPGRAVVYTRSDDGGLTWKDATFIDTYDSNRYDDGYGPYLIDVEADGNDAVHLTWDGAPTVERHHTWSKDGGNTWADPDTFIPELTGGGRALWNDMAVDSAGVLHAVSIKQPWAAQWTGGGWSQSVAIGSTGFAEDLRMTISTGNQLHVVWLQVVPGNPSVVYYVRGISSAPAITPQALPTLSPGAFGTVIATKTNVGLSPTVTIGPTVDTKPPVDLNSVNDPARGVFLSAGVVAFILIAFVFAVRLKKK